MIKFATSFGELTFKNRKDACEALGKQRYERLITEGKITFE